jgi:hypothetical protein
MRPFSSAQKKFPARADTFTPDQLAQPQRQAAQKHLASGHIRPTLCPYGCSPDPAIPIIHKQELFVFFVFLIFVPVRFLYSFQKSPSQPPCAPSRVKILATSPVLAQVIAQVPAAGWVAQLAQGIGFDLAYALAGNDKGRADPLMGAVLAIHQAKAQLQLPTLGQSCQVPIC